MAKSVRLFVAIELTDDARRAIAGEQARLRQSLAARQSSSIRWVTPDHLHLTLVFLGHVDPVRADEVVDVMRPPFAAGRFSIAFGGLGVFPPRGEPRVLWVSLTRGAEETAVVQREVVGRLEQHGLTIEERAYRPHLTIARWRSARSSDRQSVLGLDRGGTIGQVDVSTVSLFESRLSPSGSTYISRCRTPLAERAVPPLQSS